MMNDMIDEQYIAKTIGLLYLCRMTLPLKPGLDEVAFNRFALDLKESVEFLIWVSQVLPVYHELNELGELYARLGKTDSSGEENKVSALLRWLREGATADDEEKTYH